MNVYKITGLLEQDPYPTIPDEYHFVTENEYFTTLILILKLENSKTRKNDSENAIYQENYLGRTSNFMEGSTDSHKGSLLNNLISRHCLFNLLNL